MEKIPRRRFVQLTGLSILGVSPIVAPLQILAGFGSQQFPDIQTSKYFLFRPLDMLDLEFEFVNIQISNNILSRHSSSKPGYIKVKLPILHKAESAFRTKELKNLPDYALSFLSNASWLIFELKDNQVPFNVATLLNWTNGKESRLQMIGVTGASAGYDKPMNGLMQVAISGTPEKIVTTLELPTGIYLSPYTEDKTSLGFSNDNLLQKTIKGQNFDQLISIIDSWYVKTYSATLKKYRYRKQEIEDPHASVKKNQPDYKNMTLLWNNCLVTVKKGVIIPTTLKLIDTDAFRIPPSANTIPSEFDKDLLGRQFRNDANNKEFVRLLSDRLIITAMGAYAKFGYQTAAVNANLQKWIEEIVLGRDQYAEIHRLGFIYPYGHRAAEVEIAERIIVNGVAVLHRKRCIKIIDEKLMFRSGTDEKDIIPEDKLNSILFPREDYAQNTLHSLKRSFPFASLEIITKSSAPIDYIENRLETKLEHKRDALTTIKNTLASLINIHIIGKLDELNKLFQTLRNYLLHHSNKFPFNSQSWITALILSPRPIVKSDINEIFSLGLTSYASYLIFLKDFKDFLATVWSSQLLDITANEVVASLKKAADDLSKDVKNDITAKIIRLFNEIPDQQVAIFEKDFKDLAKEIFTKAPSSPACITDFTNFCKAIQEKIKLESTNAHETFLKETDVFFGACIALFMSDPKSWKNENLSFEELVKKFRLRNTGVVTFTDTTLEDINELILAYWPRKESSLPDDPGEELQFDFVATDWEGKTIKFTAPFIFVRGEAIRQGDELKKIATDKLNQINIIPDKGPAVVPSATKAETTGNLPIVNTIKLSGLQTYLNDTGNRISEYLSFYQANVSQLAGKPAAEIRAFAAAHVKMLKEINQFQDVQEIFGTIHSLDNRIKDHYQLAVNDALRKINMTSQKIAFYKSKIEEAGEDISQSITNLETRFIEFGASGITEISLLKEQLENNTASTVLHFKNNIPTIFPEMGVAEVIDPVQKEFSQDIRPILISYAGAFKSAGLERLPQASSAVLDILNEQMKERVNVEKILFDIQQYSHSAVKQSNSMLTDGRNKVKEHTTKLQNFAAMQGDQVIALLNQTLLSIEEVAVQSKKTALNYINGTMSGLLGAAGNFTGGSIDPSPVCNSLSTLKNTYYTVNNSVNQFTGKIKNSIIIIEQQGKDDIHKYTDDAKARIAAIFRNAKIFGLELQHLINIEAINPDKLPNVKITKVMGTNDGNKLPLPVAAQVNFEWSPTKQDAILQQTTNFRFGTSKNSPDKPTLEIRLNSTIPFSPGKPVETISKVRLTSFGIAITLGEMNLITLYFNSVSFTNTTVVQDGEISTSSKVEVNIANVEFDYYLKLIEKLQELLGFKGFLMDISPRGIQLSIGIRIPTVSTGPFTMTNANIYCGVVLPFGRGQLPSVRFSFSERRNPFTLAAGIYGGRGFIALEANAKGMQLFEASLEFGGYLGISLGVATGQAYLMAGIYFRGGGGASLYVEAYIVCGGSLSILGIVNVSVVFYVGMGYQNGSLVGRCSVTVSISVLFFSASYTLAFEKQISGSSQDITGIPGMINFQRDMVFNHGPNAEEQENYPHDDLLSNGYWFKNNKDDLHPALVRDPTILFSHQVTLKDARQYCDYFDI